MRQIQALGFEPLTKTVKVRDKDIVVRGLTTHEVDKVAKTAGSDLQKASRLAVFMALDLDPADYDEFLKMPMDVFDALATVLNELNSETIEDVETLEGESETSALEGDGITP